MCATDALTAVRPLEAGAPVRESRRALACSHCDRTGQRFVLVTGCGHNGQSWTGAVCPGCYVRHVPPQAPATVAERARFWFVLASYCGPMGPPPRDAFADVLFPECRPGAAPRVTREPHATA